MIKCFWMEPTGYERVWLRRFKHREGSACPLPAGYHDHMVWLKDRPLRRDDHLMDAADDYDRPSDDAVSWPTHCDCGYAFQSIDKRQVFNLPLYSGAPDGLLYALRDAPAGAMWDAEWAHQWEWMVGPDGMSLTVKLPNGHDWCVDQEASNCDKTQWLPVPGVANSRRWGGRTHYCWVRSGDPKLGTVHVSKSGVTCGAGAGSILSGSYHGYLHHGHLRDA